MTRRRMPLGGTPGRRRTLPGSLVRRCDARPAEDPPWQPRCGFVRHRHIANRQSHTRPVADSPCRGSIHFRKISAFMPVSYPTASCPNPRPSTGPPLQRYTVTPLPLNPRSPERGRKRKREREGGREGDGEREYGSRGSLTIALPIRLEPMGCHVPHTHTHTQLASMNFSQEAGTLLWGKGACAILAPREFTHNQSLPSGSITV